jgi:hypothetical protein
VKDHEGKSLAYVYFEGQLDHRSASNMLSRDEARRIATNIAKLPALLGEQVAPINPCTIIRETNSEPHTLQLNLARP